MLPKVTEDFVQGPRNYEVVNIKKIPIAIALGKTRTPEHAQVTNTEVVWPLNVSWLRADDITEYSE